MVRNVLSRQPVPDIHFYHSCRSSFFFFGSPVRLLTIAIGTNYMKCFYFSCVPSITLCCRRRSNYLQPQNHIVGK